MKRYSPGNFVILSFLLITSSICAQEPKPFTVKAGEAITSVLKPDEIYLYPGFIKGVVFYNNGTQSEALLNYNLILGKMQFIKSGKDTLVITNSDMIKRMSVNSDTFYIHRDYYRRIEGNENFMLVLKQYTKVVDIRKEGAYGMANPTGAIDNYTSWFSGNDAKMINLRASAETVFSINSDFYFGTLNGNYLPVSMKNLIKLIPGKADDIKKFIKDRGLSFRKEQDLVTITEFINSIW